jgi:hypothetical protein
MLAMPNSPYCHSHATHAKLDAATLAAELSQAAASLATPEDVHRVTAKIFLALCEDRISLKKAGMLSYLAQTLLRAHREIAIHRKMEMEWKEMEKEKSGEYSRISDWSLRLPDRSDPSSVTPADTIKPDSAVLAPSELPADSNQPLNPPVPENPPPQSPSPSSVSTATQAPPLPDLNHFFPLDLTLPPGLQDHNKNIPPPDAEELRWRELNRGRYASRRTFREWR